MINVRAEGMKGNEKKCSLPEVAAAAGPARKEKEENMTTCNSNTSPSHSPSSSSSIFSFPTSRIIKKPRRMKFFSLSPAPSPPPQLDQIEKWSPTYSIRLPIRSRRSPASTSSSITCKGRRNGSSSSSSSYPFTIKSLLVSTTVPILIPFLLLYIVIVPVSGMATASDMLSMSTHSPSSLPSSSSSPHLPRSTDTSVLSSSSSSITPLHLMESTDQIQPLVSDHHHLAPRPHSSSIPPQPPPSHLAGVPSFLSDEPISSNNNGQQQRQHQAFDPPHSCYVCLPPDKSSRDAEEILSIFPTETRTHIPECASFGSHNAKYYEFKCPPEYVGCLLKIHVSGMATASDMLSMSTHSPSSLPSSSSSPHLPRSTDTSVLSSSSSSITPLHLMESTDQIQPLVSDHHHLAPRPHSSSIPPQPPPSHLAGVPSFLSDEPISSNNNGQQQRQHQAFDPPHSCYVCLPPDKSSRDAEEILSIFPTETRTHIPECASFGSHNAKYYEFKCPPEYVGCLLKIHGRNESRSCSKFPLNDCKTANSVEHCYCTGSLCNDKRPEILLEETESDERVRSQLEEEKEEKGTRKFWLKGETDDEDLLGPHHLDIDGMQDDTGDYGSGSEPPPGVIHQYTSTPKPTLIPNIRPDTRTTTPKSVSGAPSLRSAFRIPYTSVSIPLSALQLSLVPLLLPFIQLRFLDLSSLQLLVKNQ